MERLELRWRATHDSHARIPQRCLDACRHPARLRTGAEATKRFERFFTDELGPRLPALERKEIQGLLARRPSAGLKRCRGYHALVLRTLGPAAHSSSVLHGSPGALDRDGDCWTLGYDGLLSLGLGAALDPASGEVLLVWRIPEG